MFIFFSHFFSLSLSLFLHINSMQRFMCDINFVHIYVANQKMYDTTAEYSWDRWASTGICGTSIA